MSGRGQLPTRKTRKDFQLLAELRANEAGVLARNGNEQGAWYLGGFAIECALKACIAKKFKRYEFPPGQECVRQLYSHNLKRLLEFAGLDKLMQKDSHKKRNLAISWGIVKDWDVDSRYETSGLKGRDMSVAVNSPDGVLQWIKGHW